MIFLYLLLFVLALFCALNYRQLFINLWIQVGKIRLKMRAKNIPINFKNPEPKEDDFSGNQLSRFWKFILINGAGKVSNETAWHAASVSFSGRMAIHHIDDPDFSSESSNWRESPGASRYNNITLISSDSFCPTPTKDVAIRFSMCAERSFYGTAGVIVQPAGTISSSGIFVKPFDQFGVGIVGKESSVWGINGPIVYLCLDWMQAHVSKLDVDPYNWRDYEIRLHWINQKEWDGSVSVDGKMMYHMSFPPFGPIEIHTWSDNYLVIDRPRRWWELARSADLEFQNGGEKCFMLGYIKVCEEPAVSSVVN